MGALIIIFIVFYFIFVLVTLWRKYLSTNILTLEFNPHTIIFKNRLRIDQANTLSRYSSYYRMLPEKLKGHFEHRVLKFIDEKDFEAKGDLNLTEDMKILIADSAVKLTFGLRDFLYEKFEKIIIFKGEFYSDFSKTTNKGETNPAGAIVFSWKDLLAGDENTTDGINLGLHEFAHALMVQNLSCEGCYEGQFLDNIGMFDDFYGNENKLSVVKTHHLFRNYGFRNKMEFFAVAIEQFFELPEKLKTDLPELYFILSNLLNQNPAALFSQKEA